MSSAPCPGCTSERTHVFEVEGLDCATEVALVEGGLRALPGVCSVRASAVTGRAVVVHTLEPADIERALAATGFRGRLRRPLVQHRVPARATWAAAALTAAGFAAGFFSTPLAIACYLPAIVLGGATIARRGLQRARQGALDMNALMTLAVVGAMVIGEWGEGASTVVLFSLAQLLEARSLERARRAIAGLVNLAPEQALVCRDGGEQRVAAGTVAVGETIVVAPGERFPLDGLVDTGESEADEAPLTGESRPVPKRPGSDVFAGTVNGSGALTVRVTRHAFETRLARIVRRIEEAQASRAPSQGFVERFAAIYTPAVVVLAALVAAIPPLLLGGEPLEWLYRALVLLVISCPCALVISTPISFVSALTAASRRGVLVKGGAHLEALAKARTVAFDKTGTLTRGRPEVTDVVAVAGQTEDEIVALAAAVEARSQHPLAKAIVRRAGGLQQIVPAEEARALAGLGAQGRVGARTILVGSHRLLDQRGLCDHALDPTLARIEGQGRTAILVGEVEPEGRLLGALGLADGERSEAAAAVAALQADGLRVVMLTGDNTATARAVAARLGIADVRAELMPEDKVEAVRELARSAGPVAMVGDGINDAPALAAASVGLAMGGSSDATLETADVALVTEDLRRIPEVIRLGRATRRVIAVNIALALLVKGAVLLLALFGLGSLWAAVASDMGASLLVIGNALRLLHAAPAAQTSGPLAGR